MDHHRPDPAQRLAALEAIEEIETLKARYWRAVDEGNAEAVAACLAPDARIDFEGLPTCDDAATFVATVRAAAAVPGSYHTHHGRNPDIVLDGDEDATGTWEIFYTGVILPHRMLIRMAGRYQDRYRRTDGAWRIAAMTMRQTSFLAETVGEDGVPRIAVLPGGATLDFAAHQNDEER